MRKKFKKKAPIEKELFRGRISQLKFEQKLSKFCNNLSKYTVENDDGIIFYMYIEDDDMSIHVGTWSEMQAWIFSKEEIKQKREQAKLNKLKEKTDE